MDFESARRQLEAEYARLKGLSDGFFDAGLTSQTETESFSELSAMGQHQADVGTEAFVHERDLSILEQVEAELADVEHALRRLDEGTYGICEACGSPIDDSRLEAKPEARFCLKDQEAAEREIHGPARRSP